VLEHWIEGGYTAYYTVCTQCERRWRMKQLCEKPQIVLKTDTISMRGYGQKIVISVPQIVVSQKPRKEKAVNIYLL